MDFYVIDVILFMMTGLSEHVMPVWILKLIPFQIIWVRLIIVHGDAVFRIRDCTALKDNLSLLDKSSNES